MNDAALRKAYSASGRDLCGMAHEQIADALMEWFLANGTREAGMRYGWVVLKEAGLLRWSEVNMGLALKLTSKALKIIEEG
jgi:hypothetical protein